MDGFLNINKPKGITSYDVLRHLKKNIGKEKMGHLGTLDPMATGVLPIALGKATRLIEYIENDKKAYIATMKLGAVSDTQDACGKITYTGENKYDTNKLNYILNKFKGSIKQIPPMFSAVHHNGKRLYELARQGKVVDREPREIYISELKLLSLDNNIEDNLPLITLYIECSKGTYIRTLCHDIGITLGTGAYLTKLKRVKSGSFSIEDSIKLEEINSQCSISDFLIDLDYPLSKMPKIIIDCPNNLYKIINGNKIYLENSVIENELVRLYNQDHKLIAIAELNKNDQLAIIKPLKVLK